MAEANTDRLVLGVDVGTSGVRAVAVDHNVAVVAKGEARMASFGSDGRDPAVWWAATEAALRQVTEAIDGSRVDAIAVDGTSGTMLPVGNDGSPLARGLLYNDTVDGVAILEAIAKHAPRESAAHGPTSGLAKVISLQSTENVARVIHQADWIAGQFSGRFDTSDENNALKTGYDPIEQHWPDWIGATGARTGVLPRVVEPGTPVATLTARAATDFGLNAKALVVAGTTDGCASFVATGAKKAGEAVTALGSTLVLKILSDKPLFAPEYGLYSHRILGQWLAGGASNSGGNVIAHFFSPDGIEALGREIDPSIPTGLDYYPLLRPGERFPLNDANFAPRLEPRPSSDAAFLQAIFEGIARIEALGYERLASLGAPPLSSVRTVGGGAKNEAWATIRSRTLGVPFIPAESEDAAVGTARLALASVL